MRGKGEGWEGKEKVESERRRLGGKGESWEGKEKVERERGI